MIIYLVLKIIHGSQPSKVSPSWRLLGLLKDFRSLLQPNLTFIPSHVKKESNKITDHLTNEGVASKEEMVQLDARIFTLPPITVPMDISQSVFPPLDGVPHR